MSDLDSRASPPVSDLTNAEWEIVRAILRERRRAMRARGLHGRWIRLNRNAINGIFWQVRTGCEWRALPRRYGKWNSVYRYYRRLVESGAWTRLHDALTSRPHRAVRAGMSFDEAITVHRDWTHRFSRYVREPDNSLACEAVGRDDQCALGQWIHSDCAHVAQLAEFQSMKDAHARFHAAAGDIIRRVDRGESIAEPVLGAASSYARASEEVIGALQALKSSAA